MIREKTVNYVASWRFVLEKFKATISCFKNLKLSPSIFHKKYFGVGKGLSNFFKFIPSILPKTRKSNRISKLLRPLFEHTKVQGLFGIQLIGSLLLVNLRVFTPAVASYIPDDTGTPVTQVEELVIIDSPKPVVSASKRAFYPPVEYTGVSQGFHPFHLGVDLQAPLGSAIKPIASGVVKQTDYGSFGYGNYVLVEHFNGYSSLYAHVVRIYVSKGASVDEKTVIAEVGMTGQTTGPHLHLEIHRNGIPINPKPLIGY